MSTTRCATAVLRVLLRGRVTQVALTAANLLLDTGHVVTALLVALAEIAVVIGSQPVLPGRERGQQRLHLVDVDALAELLGDRRVAAGDPDLQLRVHVEVTGRLD
ncbi:hypothetical protein DFR72_112273 [Lentzea flaviverrucosa]|uniref:Uncharacterized protein n=1 Tax=Lentzea flaviverrucosa TaxID=200379 RepID=A0A1H9W3I5_9PSEU|nr:hypothetical protein DFR72_112273 [Lentzea flaviverrucosa]SES28482.1 hypothetical protein SAMN05216195_11133 [Lentzea flaviverrucosa]